MKNNNKYNQLTQDERAVIAHLWRNGKSKNYIARDLKRSWDTIDKEMERNGEYDSFGKLIYSSKKARKKYLERRKESKKESRIIENNIELEDKLIKLFLEDNEDLSPEQIAGRFKTISFKTIYNWIWRMEDMSLKKKIVKNLRRKGKKYRKTSKLYSFESIIAPKVMIDQRPEEINNRERLGDFEGDLVKLNGTEVLLTLADRKAKKTFIRLLPNAYADLVNEEIIKIWKKNKDIFKSITFDNGPEFSKHDLLTAETDISVYFCYPYHSWEKGTIENTNGLIRQYLPKGKIHGKLSPSDIQKIEDKLNNRPRKSLNYLTPNEVFEVKKNPEENSRVQLTI